MKKNSPWSLLNDLAYFSQVGLTFVLPIVLCAFAAVWLRDRFGWGNGIVIAGILLGLIAGARSLWRFLKTMEKRSKESQEKWRADVHTTRDQTKRQDDDEDDEADH